ncbi:helix-turn-helix domain-containing protein [Amycolatopsis jiangsuensis]|uniref:Transcriptional regulator with XRE-family HTH domain n=1 Tax=Amycolatopsis jiangsuensis TaxID=1181879 RepID=A0A840IN70_9PSEU|nr:helix-turn-helix transcriptional regulator [Amycolatopsis jiangsuensis]MBB4683861.1 transcriptional regulator with XRE-family HTH domain [Amycolatopsis jiangsuensis]
MNDEQDRLAERLRRCRESSGLPQRVIAERLGVPRSAVSGFESGTRKVDCLELKSLAALYRRPVGYFLEEEAVRPPETARLLLLYQRLGTADRARLVEYAELLEIATSARTRPGGAPARAARGPSAVDTPSAGGPA